MLYKNGFAPLYKQLADVIIHKIQTREVLPGMPIPSERQLSEDHEVSRVTVRKALESLIAQGYLIRKHGKSTVVAGETALGMGGDADGAGILLGVIEELKRKNIVPEITAVDADFIPATPDVSAALHFSKAETKMFRYVRLFRHEGEPLLVNYSHVGEVAGYSIQNLDFSKDKVLPQLELLGYVVTHAMQTISLDRANAEVAGYLEIPVDEPVLMDEKTLILDNNNPISFVRTFYRPDKYKFSMRLNRKPQLFL